MALTPRGPDELLKEIPSFERLSGAELKLLSDAVEVRKVARSAPLFSEGQTAEGLYVVRTGEFKVSRSGKDGREQIVYLARPGRTIVEGIRFDGGTYCASAIAMRSGTALLIPNAALSDVGDRHPALLRALVDLRAHRSDRNLRLLSDLSLRTVPARLASFLLTLSAARNHRGEDAKHIFRDLTTETVAGRLGTVREEISRGLALLEREGALRVTPDMIEIVDPQKLENVAFGKKRSAPSQ